MMKKLTAINMMDLSNAAMFLMSSDEPEEEETPEVTEEEDHMDFLTATDEDTSQG